MRAGELVMVVVGENRAGGSDGLPQPLCLVSCALRAIIHRTRGTADGYRPAGLVALRCHSLMLVETARARAAAWRRAFADASDPAAVLSLASLNLAFARTERSAGQ